MEKRFVYSRVEDFLYDDSFIRYILERDSDSVPYWEDYKQKASPRLKELFHKASEILLHLDDCTSLSEEEVRKLKSHIFHSLHLLPN